MPHPAVRDAGACRVANAAMVGDMASILTRIITGELSGYFVFKDPDWVAMLDIYPANPGHVLLVPRCEMALVAELPSTVLGQMGSYVARLTVAVKAATGAPAVNVLINDGPAAGQAIAHAHVHIIPRHPGDGRMTHPKGMNATPAELTTVHEALRRAWG
jgi:histidine triad (HIT) family protein